MFGFLKGNNATWESKEIDRKHLFKEIGRLFAIAKRVNKDEKVRLPEHLKAPAIRSKQVNEYDIKLNSEPENKEILEDKVDDLFWNSN